MHTCMNLSVTKSRNSSPKPPFLPPGAVRRRRSRPGWGIRGTVLRTAGKDPQHQNHLADKS